MIEKVDISEAVKEVRNASEDELRQLIEKWYESTRTDGLKIGAQTISMVIFEKIKKHLKKGSKPSLRDYQRCIDDIIGIISVQLAQQNDSVATEETADDQ